MRQEYNKMKITRNQLQDLISEEIENLTYKLKKSTIDDMLSYDHPSEVKTQEDAFGGGPNVVDSVDHLKDGGSSEKSVVGIERLKMSEGNSTSLSRSQIREAINAVTKQTLLVEAHPFVTLLQKPKMTPGWSAPRFVKDASSAGYTQLGDDAGSFADTIISALVDYGDERRTKWDDAQIGDGEIQVRTTDGKTTFKAAGFGEEYLDKVVTDALEGISDAIVSKGKKEIASLGQGINIAVVPNVITGNTGTDPWKKVEGEDESSEDESSEDESSLVNESMMVSLKPIENINKEPDSGKARWMRIAGLNEAFKGNWSQDNWSKLKSKFEEEGYEKGTEHKAPGEKPDLIPEEELERVWKLTFGDQFSIELSEIEDELDTSILSKQSGKQETGFTVSQLEKIIDKLDDKFYFVPEKEAPPGTTVGPGGKSKGHRVRVRSDDEKRKAMIAKVQQDLS
jgi:hypothetical protein